MENGTGIKLIGEEMRGKNSYFARSDINFQVDYFFFQIGLKNNFRMNKYWDVLKQSADTIDI